MNRWQGTLRAEDALEFLAAETGLAYNSPEGAIMARGIEAEVYQPFLSAMTVHAAERVKEGEFDVQSTVNALVIAAGLYADADEDYRSNPDRLQGEALKSHQGNVLDGTIQRVNPINATTFQQGRLQVIRATERLAGQPSEEQSVLAALNYGTVFDPKTMATAQETLERQEIDELLETVAGEYDEAMPHLTISNWAIGQIVAGIYDRASISSAEFRRPRVRVFDMGAGSGATLAAIISSINALQERDRGVELAISPIETTPELYEQLDSFIKNNPMIQDIGLHAVSRSEKGKASISQFGVLTAVKSDAVEEMCRFYVPFNNDVNVVVANYSWHRISKDKKGQLMERFADTDTIFIVGDLVENTSDLDRRYFNLGANGPLNVGNRFLRQQFLSHGYELVNLAQYIPENLDSRLATRLLEDSVNNDGHLWIAYCGKKAQDLLKLQPRIAN